MLGYREARRHPSARLDDAVMWLPARLSALLLAATTLLPGAVVRARSHAAARRPQLRVADGDARRGARGPSPETRRLRPPARRRVPRPLQRVAAVSARWGLPGCSPAALAARGWSRGPDRAAGRSRFLTRLPGRPRGGRLAGVRASPWAFPLAGYAVGALLATRSSSCRRQYPEPPSRSRTSRGSSPSPASTTSTASRRTSATPPWSTATQTTAVRAEGHHGRRRRCDRRGVRLRRPRRRRIRRRQPSARTRRRRRRRRGGRREFGQAAVAALGTATHEGLGSQFTSRASGHDLLPAAVVALPAVALSWPSPAAGGSLAGAVGASLLALWWVRRLLGGVSGDAFGLVNGSVASPASTQGVIVWTLS